jgi:hypothetical protein
VVETVLSFLIKSSASVSLLIARKGEALEKIAMFMDCNNIRRICEDIESGTYFVDLMVYLRFYLQQASSLNPCLSPLISYHDKA